MGHKTISHKKVLLVANASLLHDEVILYGVNLSRRVDASLEVLHFLKEQMPSEAAQSFREHIRQHFSGEPVGYIQLLNDRGIVIETIEYARNRRNILCVILCLDGEGAPKRRGVRQRKFDQVTQMLHCPVVLYSGTNG